VISPAWLAGVEESSTGQPFQNNRIPRAPSAQQPKQPSVFGPAELRRPTTTTSNLLITAPDRFSDGLLTIKIDHELNAGNRLSGRYSRAPHDETTTPGLPTFEQIIPPHNQIGW